MNLFLYLFFLCLFIYTKNKSEKLNKNMLKSCAPYQLIIINKKKRGHRTNFWSKSSNICAAEKFHKSAESIFCWFWHVIDGIYKYKYHLPLYSLLNMLMWMYILLLSNYLSMFNNNHYKPLIMSADLGGIKMEGSLPPVA